MNKLSIYNKVRPYFRKRIAARNTLSPTQEMMESRIFFKENNDRVVKITSLLADKQSKDCYLKIIKFRQFYDINKFPFADANSAYFWHDFISYSDKEVLVDCGAFTGDSIDSFVRALRYYGGKHRKIIAFEPDPMNCKILAKSKKRTLTIMHSGVWSEDTTLHFNSNGECSKFDCTQESVALPKSQKLPVRSIDNCDDCQDATFIKMDIEGSELQALMGARNVIQKNKPTLAICIYHSNEDMIRIAEFIHELVPEYRLYVRHHTAFSVCDTVLYAV